jgi:hypothetical protein
MRTDPHSRATNGALTATVYGVAAAVAPRTMMRAQGMGRRDINTASIILQRLFGARDIALGLITLEARDDPQHLTRVHSRPSRRCSGQRTGS